MSVYPDKICHLQLNSRQIILLRLKSHHFRTYFLYMTRYNNVSRPVHDPLRPPLPTAKNLGVVTPSTSRVDAYARLSLNIHFLGRQATIRLPAPLIENKCGHVCLNTWQLLCRSI